MGEGITLGAALIAGLVGSAHCFGMCGGIAGAMGMASAQHGMAGARLGAQSVLYNLGRVASYTIAGIIAGAFGAALGGIVDLPYWSLILRGMTGLILVLLGLQIAFGWRLLTIVERGGAHLWRRVAPLAGRLLGRGSAAAALGLGMIWGWLPCGLTYSLLLVAATTGSAIGGAGVMFAFGIGTLPAMIAAAYAGGRLGGLPGGRRARLGAGILIVLMGVWTAAVPMRHLAHSAGDGPMQHEHHGG